MSNFVDILEGQIDEDRKARPKTPVSEGDGKNMIQKKTMVPLRVDMEIQSEEVPEGQSQGGALWGPNPNMEEVEASRPGGGGALWGPRMDEKEKSPEKPQVEQKGGALWGTPAAEAQPKPAPAEGKCLMDLIMEPPPQPLKPTLFTYFDKLMANGEV